MRILGICGSLQENSANQRLLEVAARLVPDGVTLTLYDGLAELPHFNPDLEAVSVPPSVEKLRMTIAASDALLIASPEYGHSLPGSLKNAIDWLIGSGELERKVIGTTASVPARERGQRGLQALAVTLGAVRATVVGGAPIPRGPSFEPELSELLQTLIAAARADGD